MEELEGLLITLGDGDLLLSFDSRTFDLQIFQSLEWVSLEQLNGEFLSTIQDHDSDYQISQSLDELEYLMQELDGPEITAATHSMSQINIGSNEEGEEMKSEETDPSESTDNSSSSYIEPDPILAAVVVPDDLSTQGYMMLHRYTYQILTNMQQMTTSCNHIYGLMSWSTLKHYIQENMFLPL